MGRPKGTYKFTVEEIEQGWQEFKDKCDKQCVYEASAGKVLTITKPQVYTLEGFLLHIGMDEDTLNRYEKLPRFSRTVSRIKREVFANKKIALLNGYGNTQGLLFDMRANYRITEKQEMDVNLAATITKVEPKVIDPGVPLASSEKEIQE